MDNINTKSDIELAVESSKSLVSLLECKYSATDRGLHDAMTRLATNRLSRRVTQGLAFALMAAVWAVPAEAHVKWFTEFDIAKPPRPI